MTEETQDIAEELVPADLRGELIALLGDRLTAGEPLIAPSHFQKAMEEGYQVLRGRSPSEAVKSCLGKVFVEVARENPDVLVVPGVENWIVRAILGKVRNNGWGITETQIEGQNLLRQFLHQDQARAVLLRLDLKPTDLNIRNCMRRVVNAVAGKDDPGRKRAEARLAEVKAKLQAPPSSDRPSAAGLDQLLAGPAAEPDAAEVESRTDEQRKLQAVICQQQMANLMDNLETYVEEGRLSQKDAERLQKLNKVEKAVESGRVSREQGSKARNSILAGGVRTEVQKKLREEVDYVVVYAQVFEALQRIDSKNDPALRFMINHKRAVNSDGKEEVEWKPVVAGLVEELETLHQLIEIMDRQDAEVRMMAAQLPPYNQVIRRGQNRMENLVIEEDFVDLLRAGTRDQIIAKLGGSDRKERVRLAASMLSVNALVTTLLKDTPFRKQVRVLKINLIVEEFFRSAVNVAEAKEKAEVFLLKKLPRLYPDITAEEAIEIQEQSREILAACEQKLFTEKATQAEAEGWDAEGLDGKDGGDERLSAEEIARGVHLGRVVIRAGGGTKLVPYRIMPDPEDKTRWIMVKRDRENDELVPVRRRGKKRYVEKNREGAWEVQDK